jgi:hypothetical protein
MSRAALRPEVQRFLLGGLPFLLLGASLLLALPRAAQLCRLQREIAALQPEAAVVPRNGVPGPGAGSRELGATEGAALADRREQDAFLKQLSALMAASHVRMVAYRPPAAEDRAPRKESGEETSLVLPRIAQITVEGPYGDLIAFFRSLEESERLLSPETLQITAERHPRLTATFRLARYVVREASCSP